MNVLLKISLSSFAGGTLFRTLLSTDKRITQISYQITLLYFRYSGCHGYDESAFNIVCGLAFNFNEEKYSVTEFDGALFYKQSIEDSIRMLENRKKNISETSEHPYSEE